MEEIPFIPTDKNADPNFKKLDECIPKNIKYLSIFSGIEAASLAWTQLGWECVAVCEIEPFPCAVLSKYYPNTPNLGDVTQITEDMIKSLGNIDLIVFGSPCQDLSVAGKRQGLTGSKSGLFYDAINIIEWAKKYCGCRWALWENVPGAFSSNRGADFAEVVKQMAGLDVDVPPKGWGNEGCAIGEKGMVEWSTLDAQWFGVAQRRRRVFALTDFGDWFNREPILLESEIMRGDSPPSREEGGEASNTIGPVLASGSHTVGTLMTRGDSTGNQQAFSGNYFIVERDNLYLRRLTPLEFERLQGFPDNFTKIDYRLKPADKCPDTPRYKALGNSMAIPVMKWVGQRISKIY